MVFNERSLVSGFQTIFLSRCGASSDLVRFFRSPSLLAHLPIYPIARGLSSFFGKFFFDLDFRDRAILSAIIPDLVITAIEIFLTADSYYNSLTSIENR
jgi:hypothetical protein